MRDSVGLEYIVSSAHYYTRNAVGKWQYFCRKVPFICILRAFHNECSSTASGSKLHIDPMKNNHIYRYYQNKTVGIPVNYECDMISVKWFIKINDRTAGKCTPPPLFPPSPPGRIENIIAAALWLSSHRSVCHYALRPPYTSNLVPPWRNVIPKLKQHNTLIMQSIFSTVPSIDTPTCTPENDILVILWVHIMFYVCVSIFKDTQSKAER